VPDSALNLENQSSKSEIQYEDFCVCSFIANIEKFIPNSFIININSICSHFFVIKNFDMPSGTIFTSHLFLTKSRLSSPNGDMVTKNVTSQVSRTKNTQTL